MKSFIRYLYEYQNGKRTRNTGFVKVLEQEEATVVQIYGRGFPVAGGRTLEIYLFYEEDGQCIGILMGEIRGAQAAFGYKLSYTAGDVGGTERFGRIGGMLLRTENGADTRYYGAVWEDEKPVDISRMIPEKELDVIKELKNDQNMSEEGEADPALIPEPAKDVIYKITRQELAGLPRKEWKLANNHFLLHGYYNYHHLVSFEKEGKCWIGVPGLYFPGEQRAAGAFGFSQFMKPSDGELDLEEYEIEDEEHFGYWCRPVGAVIRKEVKEKEDAADIDRRRKIHEGSDPSGEKSMED